jgi:PiT family inorganic phosphate transporter
VAVALGLGTMVGWKRIVVTVGEKIGKSHLTYGQGAAAELVAALTIFAADNFGLPVSTTHVLSSGVAGTMAANASGLQSSTVVEGFMDEADPAGLSHCAASGRVASFRAAR